MSTKLARHYMLNAYVLIAKATTIMYISRWAN